MEKHHIFLIIMAMLVTSCASYRQEAPSNVKIAIKEALDEQQQKGPPIMLPTSVQNELLPQYQPDIAPSLPEKRLRIAAQEVEAVAFFGSLFKGSRYSVAVHPGVSGLISVELKDVTLSEVLAAVSDMYGFNVQRKGYIFHIYPAGLRTETIPINYLMMVRRGISRSTVQTGGVSTRGSVNSSSSSASTNSNSDSTNSNSDNSNNNNTNSSNANNNSNGSRIETGTNNDYWSDLRDALQSLIGSGDGRAVIVSPQAGLVTVRAYPQEIKVIREFLTQSETHLQRQVVLEARILEVSLNEGYEQGVDWSGLSATWNNNKGITSGGSLVPSDLAGTLNPIFTALGGGATFKISDGSFNVAVNLLKTQGDVNTLSSPRVTASNNQKAVIKVGTDEYFVTNASTTITTNASGISDRTPSVELTPFFSGIALDVTAQIAEEGRVMLHIHPTVVSTEEQKKIIDMGVTGGKLELPLAKSSIRESDTVVQANNGDIIVIGGLMKSDKQELVSKVPLLGDIPWLGELFTNRSESTKKVELVILLKPTVVESDTWQQELQRSAQLLEKWYPSEG